MILNVFFIGSQASDKNTPKDILAKARKFTMSANFKATDLKLDGKDRGLTIYRMVTPDDHMLLQRNDSPHTVTVINKEGVFCWRKDNGAVVGNTVIKLSGALSRNNVFNFMQIAAYYGRFNLGKYSIVEVNHNKIPCYQIQVKYPDDDATLAKLTRHTIKTLDKERAKGTIAVMTFWIGKEKPFIYACDYYDFHGKKIMSLDWKVELGAVTDKKLFTLPKNVTIAVANTREELSKIMKENYSPANWVKWRKSKKGKK